MNVYARMGLGGFAGAAATYLMDAASELLYSEAIGRREREIQEQPAAQAVAEKLLRSLDLNPSDKDVKRVAPLLHWALGITSGMLAGALSKEAGVRSSLAVGAGMFVFDEVGLSFLGAAPSSTCYPWQTNLRSLVAHAAYGISLG